MEKQKPFYQTEDLLGKDGEGHTYIKTHEQLIKELLMKTTTKDKSQPADYFYED